jgi:hypothetical protein
MKKHLCLSAVVLLLTASYSASDGTVVGDHGQFEVLVPANAPHAYSAVGTYALKTMITDQDGTSSSAAFDLPIAKHLGLQVDLLVGGVVHKTWRFELHGYNDPTENPAFRLGSGPAGPGGYLNSIAQAWASPVFGPLLRNTAFLKNLSDVTKANLGVDFPFAWNITNGLAEFFLAGSLRNAYGIYLAPTQAQGMASRLGQISPLQLLSLLLSTSSIVSKTSTEGFFLDTPGSHTTVTSADGFQLLPPGQFVLHPSMQTGLGYDPLSRNSNSFIGSILRAGGLDNRVANQLQFVSVGFKSNFTDWTNWDLALQNYISAQAKAAGL